MILTKPLNLSKLTLPEGGVQKWHTGGSDCKTTIGTRYKGNWTLSVVQLSIFVWHLMLQTTQLFTMSDLMMALY